MNIWILTIGTSDVQLQSKAANLDRKLSDKKFSEKIWSTWACDCEENWEVEFKPSQAVQEANDPYRIPPRALGEVYQESNEARQAEIFSYLVFPLFDNFLQAFAENPPPDSIFLLLTNQEALFPVSEILQRRNPKSPYWQDTEALSPIVTQYLQSHFQEHHGCEPRVFPIVLKPETTDQSLENWNAVLELVRDQFQNLTLDQEKFDPTTCDRVYVSHQAGTPAISSAVQFMSLATFRDSVEFLVSHETQDLNNAVPVFDTVKNSTYLGALRLQEAKALLKRYDYAGALDILGLREAKGLKGTQKDLKILLDAGELWNFAEFHKFKAKLKTSRLVKVTEFPWWQLGYESALLAYVRLNQDNTVEAMFHSFRAMEGMINQWALRYYRSHISQKGDKNYKEKYGPQVQKSICSILPEFYKGLSKPNQKKLDEYQQIGLYGDPLYLLFQQGRPDWIHHSHISVIWDTAKNERNSLFHNIEGFQPSDVFSAWIDTSYGDPNEHEQRWKECLLSCLNFIALQDITSPFSTLEDASLMSKVHQEIESLLGPSRFGK